MNPIFFLEIVPYYYLCELCSSRTEISFLKLLSKNLNLYLCWKTYSYRYNS